MNKKTLNIILLVVGAMLIALSFTLLKGEAYKTINGAFLGIGAGTAGLAFSNLAMMHWYSKHPKDMKQAEINAKDERSEIIRNKAKAKCSDIIQWTVMAAAWIAILAGAPLWLTLLLVGIFLSKNIIELILMNKYNNEM